MRPRSALALRRVSEMRATWKSDAPRAPSRGINRVLALPGDGERAKIAMAGDCLNGEGNCDRNSQAPVARPRTVAQINICSSCVVSLAREARRRENRNSRPERRPFITAVTSWMGARISRRTTSAVLSTFSMSWETI